MKDKIDAYFEEHKGELIADLKKLVAIESSKSEAQPGMPFGAGCAKVLAEAESICAGMGFRTRSFNGCVMTADAGSGEPRLGILAHLDTVPVGDGWTRRPLAGDIEDGRMYGRGAADDKGACVAAMYAMRAAAELSELKRGCRLIMGTDEECGSSDLVGYRKLEAMPPLLFSPDAEFPVYNTEKGRFAPKFSARWEQPENLKVRVTQLHGGDTPNVVPHKAWAIVEGVAPGEGIDLADEFTGKTGVKMSVSPADNGVRFSAKGLAAHASQPELGKNALTALIALLAASPAEGEVAEKLRCLARLMPYGETDGSSLGVAESDELSGALTVNFSVLDADESGMSGLFDSRTPVCTDMEGLVEKVDAALSAGGITLDTREYMPAHNVDPDSDFIRSLLSAYEEFTGNKGECRSMGGATYAHGIPGAVSFGAAMPDEEGNIHAPDEYVVLEDLVTAAKIFTKAIIDICSL